VAHVINPRALSPALTHVLAYSRDPFQVVAQVLDGSDAVGQEHLSHPGPVVNVQVDQARHDVLAAYIDDPSRGGIPGLAPGARLNDLVAFDDDHCVPNRRAPVTVYNRTAHQRYHLLRLTGRED